MDISTIKDIQQLKSLAYEQVVALETAKANLQALQARMQQLEEVTKKPAK